MVIDEYKKPPIKDIGKWISVEIECIFDSDSDIELFVSFVHKKGYINFVTLKDDGSIDGDYGTEIIVTFHRNRTNILKDICKKLNELEVSVNSSCGLHVHFDCRHLMENHVTVLGNRIGRCVNALKQILSKSRRSNEFCYTDVSPIHSETRYAFVNLTSFRKHRTIEVRGHNGTINATKILNWIELLRKIMSVKRTESIYDIRVLLKQIKMSVRLRSYIKKRFKRFKHINQAA